MSFVLSDVITSIDNNPQYRPGAGVGGLGRRVSLLGNYAAGATDASTIIYRMVRVPTNAIIKKVEVTLDLQGGTATHFQGSVGLYYSDNANDGTPLLSVASATAVSASFFAKALDMHTFITQTNTVGTGQFTDITFANATGTSATDGFYVPSASNYPLWLALTSGGYQGVLTATGQPESGYTANWAGLGAVSSTTNPFYKISQDPGGFLDICFQITTQALSLDASHIFSMRVEMDI